MKINFDELPESSRENLLGGEGAVFSRGTGDALNKFMILRLPKGSSVGMHTHTKDSEANYVLSGKAYFLIDGREEYLVPGECHYCPKGSSHNTVNCGDEDLVLLTFIPEQ